MIKQEFRGASGILLPGAITIPKGEEIAISQDWLIFPEAIIGEGKVWTIDGLLEPCIKPDNEVWVNSNVENPFAGPIIYKGKNKYGWQVGEIPENVTNELDFIDRKQVRNIILSNYVTEISDQAFFECYDLQNIIISNSVKRIGNIAFFACGNLQTLTIPDTVIEMGGGIFSNCHSLKYIKLPNTLIYLDPYLYTNEEYSWSEDLGFFQNCNSLQNIVLPQTIENIGDYAFYSCHSLTSINIPDGVTSIESSTFKYCSSLTSITIPNSVMSIGNDAFYNCYSLTTVTIGNSIISIGEKAFFNNPLQRIVSYAETPPTIEWNTFENVDKSIPLEVPNADLYREAHYWQEFYNIYNINPYQLNVSSNNEEWGTVRILEHNTNRSVIDATSKEGYVFKQWSDGNTNSWRELNIIEDTTLVAEFGEPYQCEIVNLEVIDSTPTSVTVRFEITCNEERDTLNYVSVCINNGEFCGSVQHKSGVQETIIEGLQPETTYHIEVAVENDAWQWVERYIEFTTPSLPYPSLPYSYVDLGLPSGTLWSDKNVGAENPWDNGAYFSWGNVDGHTVDESGNTTDGYSFDTITYSTTLGGQYTGSELDAEHDAATVNMGGEWRMPTKDEMGELVGNTDHYYIDENGNILTKSELDGSINLRSICFVKKSENFDYDNRSNFIEIPFAGLCSGSELIVNGLYGYIWSRSVLERNMEIAYQLYLDNDGSIDADNSGQYRHCGLSIRGVKNNY